MNTINVRCCYNDKSFDIKIPENESLLNLKHYIVLNLKTFQIYTYDTNINIRYGFPPKLIDNNTSDTKTLPELQITNNECLRVDLIDPNCVKSSENEIIDYSKYKVKKQVILADNSCLFNAVNFAINQCLSEPSILRSIISSTILDNPVEYNETVWERNVGDYCEWILRGDSWGGGIEWSIWSKFFNIRIGVVDIKNITIQYFGEGYKEIIYWLYNNVHYDVFYQELEWGKISGIFQDNDEVARNQVLEIARELQKHEKYIDTQNFSIKCMQCNFLMKGENDVVEHSKKTGHSNFNQV